MEDLSKLCRLCMKPLESKETMSIFENQEKSYSMKIITCFSIEVFFAHSLSLSHFNPYFHPSPLSGLQDRQVAETDVHSVRVLVRENVHLPETVPEVRHKIPILLTKGEEQEDSSLGRAERYRGRRE